MGGREEVELVLFSPLPVSWPSLLFEGQGGVSSVLIHFLPSVLAAEMHTFIVLCFTSLCVQASLLLLFTCLSLNWLRPRAALFCNSIPPLLCDWAEGPREFCTFSFPTLPFHMRAKGDLSKNVHLMSIGDRRCPSQLSS